LSANLAKEERPDASRERNRPRISLLLPVTQGEEPVVTRKIARINAKNTAVSIT
jgi:hypothetical protein